MIPVNKNNFPKVLNDIIELKKKKFLQEAQEQNQQQNQNQPSYDKVKTAIELRRQEYSNWLKNAQRFKISEHANTLDIGLDEAQYGRIYRDVAKNIASFADEKLDVENLATKILREHSGDIYQATDKLISIFLNKALSTAPDPFLEASIDSSLIPQQVVIPTDLYSKFVDYLRLTWNTKIRQANMPSIAFKANGSLKNSNDGMFVWFLASLSNDKKIKDYITKTIKNAFLTTNIEFDIEDDTEFDPARITTKGTKKAEFLRYVFEALGLDKDQEVGALKDKLNYGNKIEFDGTPEALTADEYNRIRNKIISAGKKFSITQKSQVNQDGFDLDGVTTSGINLGQQQVDASISLNKDGIRQLLRKALIRYLAQRKKIFDKFEKNSTLKFTRKDYNAAFNILSKDFQNIILSNVQTNNLPTVDLDKLFINPSKATIAGENLENWLNTRQILDNEVGIGENKITVRLANIDLSDHLSKSKYDPKKEIEKFDANGNLIGVKLNVVINAIISKFILDANIFIIDLIKCHMQMVIQSFYEWDEQAQESKLKHHDFDSIFSVKSQTDEEKEFLENLKKDLDDHVISKDKLEEKSEEQVQEKEKKLEAYKKYLNDQLQHISSLNPIILGEYELHITQEQLKESLNINDQKYDKIYSGLLNIEDKFITGGNTGKGEILLLFAILGIDLRKTLKIDEVLNYINNKKQSDINHFIKQLISLVFIQNKNIAKSLGGARSGDLDFSNLTGSNISLARGAAGRKFEVKETDEGEWRIVGATHGQRTLTPYFAIVHNLATALLSIRKNYSLFSLIVKTLNTDYEDTVTIKIANENIDISKLSVINFLKVFLNSHQFESQEFETNARSLSEENYITHGEDYGAIDLVFGTGATNKRIMSMYRSSLVIQRIMSDIKKKFRLSIEKHLEIKDNQDALINMPINVIDPDGLRYELYEDDIKHAIDLKDPTSNRAAYDIDINNNIVKKGYTLKGKLDTLSGQSTELDIPNFSSYYKELNACMDKFEELFIEHDGEKIVNTFLNQRLKKDVGDINKGLGFVDGVFIVKNLGSGLTHEIIYVPKNKLDKNLEYSGPGLGNSPKYNIISNNVPIVKILEQHFESLRE
jgi:hypothetical protein